MTALVKHLSQAASDYARRAVEAYAADRHGDFALFAGVGLELAVKAKLARLSPLLLVPERNFTKPAVLLHRAEDNVELLRAIRTVDFDTAIER